jgi:hypothetical protein
MQNRNTAHWQQIRIYKTPLILALVIHLVFVFMLARLTPSWQELEDEKHQIPENVTLSVSLQRPIPEPPDAETPEQQIPEKTRPPEPAEVPIPAIVPPEPAPQQMAEAESAKPPEQTSSAQLLSTEDFRSQLLQQLLDNRNTNTPLRLGTFRSHELPANWTRKAIDYTPGMFKAAELPTRAIVLDQWQNMDGSQQNKVKLPNGDVVCGSLAAQNPLDIYSLPIWMYHSC